MLKRFKSPELDTFTNDNQWPLERPSKPTNAWFKEDVVATVGRCVLKTPFAYALLPLICIIPVGHSNKTHLGSFTRPASLGVLSPSRGLCLLEFELPMCPTWMACCSSER